jgi:Flp pilus assembly protein TadG
LVDHEDEIGIGAEVNMPVEKLANKRIARSRRGAVAVEFAIAAPIFFVFLLAAFEFGWLNVVRHTAENAAYEAARSVMVPGASAAEATAKATSVLNVVGARGVIINITPSSITNSTTEVTVAIDIPMSSNGLITPRFTGKTMLHSVSTLKTERPN